jgi:AcrR family transcriptional regulator
MPVTRHGASSESNGGRVNQKRRTREAIVSAAQELVDEGSTPTVAQAAERALVSRTTAYRYFPTQESLTLELTVSIDVPGLEAMVAEPTDAEHAPAHVIEVLDCFNRHVLDNEELFRRTLRVYLDMWLAARESDDPQPTVRAGRRAQWLATMLEPVRGTVPNETLQRLERALCIVMGMEPLTVLRDVCGLAPDDALEVTRWAAEALIATALDDNTRADGARVNGRAGKTRSATRRR